MNIDSRETPSSLGQIIGGLAGDIQDLVRGEIALAKSELDQKMQNVALSAGWMIGGALLAMAGLVVFLIGIASLLAEILPPWAASLAVGIVTILIGIGLVRAGIAMLTAKSIMPDRTAANLQKDVNLVREHT